ADAERDHPEHRERRVEADAEAVRLGAPDPRGEAEEGEPHHAEEDPDLPLAPKVRLHDLDQIHEHPRSKSETRTAVAGPSSASSPPIPPRSRVSASAPRP